MFKFFEKSNNTAEQKEREDEKLNVLVFDDSEDKLYAESLDFHFNEDDNFPTRAVSVSEVGKISRMAENGGFDVIFVATPDNLNKNLAAEITKIRNNKKIKKQPLFFVMKSRRNEKELEGLKEFDDVIEVPSFIHIEKLVSQFKSVPELLGYIEDQYGDRWQKNKISFYKEYKDKIDSRAEVTADTEKELEILENVLQENNAKKILDAGGGNGRIAIPLSNKGYEVTNADSSWELLEEMKKKTDKVKAVEADLRKLPAKEGQFDAVTYNWHVFCDILGDKSKRQVLSEAFRVLRKGGVIVLDLPDREKGSCKKDGIYINYPGGESVFVGYIPTENEMEEYLKEAGFKDIKINKWETKSGFPKISFTGRK
jgi:ubiquinone/menaquinone biosynthesis C-methylase UbiE